jgi:hypothetical protein
LHRALPKTKIPLERCASGLISALYLKALSRPERARRKAVMMMVVPMRPMNHDAIKIHKFWRNRQPKIDEHPSKIRTLQ